MSDPPSDLPAEIADDVDDGVFTAVRDGYDAVYGALPGSPTFQRLWRSNAYHGEFPLEFAHIGFLTLGEARQLKDLLSVGADDLLVDVACGAGGPGLWMAEQTGAALIGIDPSLSGLVAARQRAVDVELAGRSRFQLGTFERTGLDDQCTDALMSVEAFQYAPDKRAAAAEFARVLRPGGRLGIVCFEVEPSLVIGVPVLGIDPVADYTTLLHDAGFVVQAYDETAGWQDRVYGAFEAIVAVKDALAMEMGDVAAANIVTEAALTVQLKPYRRRVLSGASRRS